MKKDKAIIVLIAIWQLFLAVYTTDVLVHRAINILSSTGNYYSDLPAAINWMLDIFIVVYSPVAILVFIGLLIRKNWGRVLGVFSSGLTILCVTVFLMFFVLTSRDGYYQIYELILLFPIVLMLILILLGVLSFFYLKKPRVKELFKNKPALS